ncbi:MAG: hypothetical protein M0P12_12790 [Paludibacteraceae bacterium]|nr:hypothetical protein [Paludibacteraceae bacterium]HOI26370.1 hypothetical protein [Paludibacteraceae bacterium]HOU68350.1 hypothetical protein [Paludibacteraceae bacterium]HPH63749.1 hypothetical protein [Paludibacteraceae bacterium]HQF50207.1 hypothetical protein [Paludibacteraceae bacterium]
MKEDVKKSILWLTAIISVTGIAGYVIFRMFLHEYYFSAYPHIMTYYWILGVLTIVSIVNATKKSGQKYFNTFMIMKTVKLLSLIIVCGLYLLLIKEQAISFLITFVLFYIIYTIFEAQVSIKLNKKTKDEAAQK